MDWASHTFANTPAFGLQGVEGEARLVDCYDGDTCKVLLSIPWAGGAVRLATLRLSGIDAPEMATHDPVEKDLAVRARDRMLNLLCPAGFPQRTLPYSKKEVKQTLEARTVLVHVTCEEQDKYGRCLAVLHNTDGACINTTLLCEGLGDPYDGGTKPRSWES